MSGRTRGEQSAGAATTTRDMREAMLILPGKHGGLWRHHGFVLLWGGQTISQLGSQVTLWALPLTAVLVLKATPGQMGLLAAAGSLPMLLFGLLAGAWVDRVRRRPLLITADLARALLLGSVPAAALLGRLSLAQLYVVAFLAGILSVFFAVAYQSFVPSLVERDQLVEANSKLEVSSALAGVAGPGLAGELVQLIGPVRPRPAAPAGRLAGILGAARFAP